MMFGGTEGLRRIMNKETLKPKRVSETLGRFAQYFKPYGIILVLVIVLVVGATWAQVTAPALIGQAVDCYLAPAAAVEAATIPGISGSVSPSDVQSTCTVVEHPLELSQTERLAGLGTMILEIIGLYIITSLLTGLTFYLMNWSGSHVLRQMRVDY
jgi:ATP-binding cassette subfamily B protein